MEPSSFVKIYTRVEYWPKHSWPNRCFIVQCSGSKQAASSFLFCFYFYFCDLIATGVAGRGKGGNQIKIPLYYPAVGMPLAGIRARLRSSARCVLGGLPPVHKRNYSDRRAGDTKRPGVPVEGTEEDGTAPSGPRIRKESQAGRRKLCRGAHPASRCLHTTVQCGGKACSANELYRTC